MRRRTDPFQAPATGSSARGSRGPKTPLWRKVDFSIRNTATTRINIGRNALFKPPQTGFVAFLEKCKIVNKDGHCGGVAVQNRKSGEKKGFGAKSTPGGPQGGGRDHAPDRVGGLTPQEPLTGYATDSVSRGVHLCLCCCGFSLFILTDEGTRNIIRSGSAGPSARPRSALGPFLLAGSAHLIRNTATTPVNKGWNPLFEKRHKWPLWRIQNARIVNVYGHCGGVAFLKMGCLAKCASAAPSDAQPLADLPLYYIEHAKRRAGWPAASPHQRANPPGIDNQQLANAGACSGGSAASATYFTRAPYVGVSGLNHKPNPNESRTQ